MTYLCKLMNRTKKRPVWTPIKANTPSIHRYKDKLINNNSNN